MLFVVEPMTLADVDQVMQIEHKSFSAPWSARAYRFEIAENDHSTMLVVRPALRWSGSLAAAFQRFMGLQPGPVLGYAGAWLLVDEFHVSTIAVHPEWRRRGIGELLLLSLLEKGAELKLARATLEVRLSNLAAQTLYRKYGFEIVSRQKAYYADNNEDAYIMATPTLDSPVYQAHLSRCRAQLHARWRGEQQAREPAAGAPQTP
jgi:[ribosomal protein S18]-alanine N-acetyltransferase